MHRQMADDGNLRLISPGESSGIGSIALSDLKDVQMKDDDAPSARTREESLQEPPSPASARSHQPASDADGRDPDSGAPRVWPSVLRDGTREIKFAQFALFCTQAGKRISASRCARFS